MQQLEGYTECMQGQLWALGLLGKNTAMPRQFSEQSCAGLRRSGEAEKATEAGKVWVISEKEQFSLGLR